MIKTIGNYGISTIEAIQVFDSFGKAIASLEQQVERTEMFNLTSNISASSFEKTNASGKVYDLSKSYNCRNCGAPVYGCKCNYCGTHY